MTLKHKHVLHMQTRPDGKKWYANALTASHIRKTR